MTLKDYSEDVNRLAQVAVDILNADMTKLFGAVHHAFPESMLRYYYERGYTAAQAIESINHEGRSM